MEVLSSFLTFLFLTCWTGQLTLSKSMSLNSNKQMTNQANDKQMNMTNQENFVSGRLPQEWLWGGGETDILCDDELLLPPGDTNLPPDDKIRRARCITVSGPASGSACVFPFNFGGVSHSKCTTIDGDTKPWCSTKTDANGDHVSGVGAWGYCEDNCSGSDSGSTVCSATSGPASGSTCIFPFNFNGVSYSSCATTEEDPRPWCSTQTDANNNHVSGVGAWGYCDAICPVQGTVPPTTTTAPPESCQCGVKGGDSNTRIVGGQETKEHEYPWQVGIVSRNGRRPWCGGTLISSTHVLTAAHCFENKGVFIAASSIRVLLGEHNVADNEFTRVDVAEIINHPNYDSRTTDNDYAILRLENRVTFNNKVSPACLPADLSSTYANVLATATGWGRVRFEGPIPNVLQEVDVTVVTNAECNRAYRGKITSNMVCAADSGKDSCEGDSGGPLIAPENGRQALIGVVSWGGGCADRRYPGVYARVTEKMDWILANTAGAFSSTCRALN